MAEARGRPLWLRFRSRRSVLALEEEARAALAHGDVAVALVALETLARRYRWHAPVEALLFRRAARPAGGAQAEALLRGIAACAGFRRHHRAYAAVSLVYRAAASGDCSLARELQVGLEAAVAELEADPATLHCGRRNRENRLKRLISSRAALLHLALLQHDQQALAAIGPWAHALLARLDFDRLPADVSLRLMSNFGRCLALQAPLAPQALRLDLERLVAEAARPRHRHSRAPEDHLGFLRGLLADLGTGAPLLAILNVDTPELRAGLGAFWQAAAQGRGA
ncbi:hypothetical protein KBY76_07250 [Synechococcus sp. GreenBA-s]|nr:hypothetical protein [Synechococcus sp. GreenBA-s]